MMVKTSGEGVLASAPRRRNWKAEDPAKTRDLVMRAMKDDGVPMTYIAEVFNVDRSTVARRLAAIPEGASLGLN